MELIPYPEAQERFHISRMTLWRLVKSGVVAAYRPGKKTMFSVRDLEIWLASTRIKPKTKIGRPRKGAPRV